MITEVIGLPGSGKSSLLKIGKFHNFVVEENHYFKVIYILLWVKLSINYFNLCLKLPKNSLFLALKVWFKIPYRVIKNYNENFVDAGIVNVFTTTYCLAFYLKNKKPEINLSKHIVKYKKKISFILIYVDHYVALDRSRNRQRGLPKRINLICKNEQLLRIFFKFMNNTFILLEDSFCKEGIQFRKFKNNENFVSKQD